MGRLTVTFTVVGHPEPGGSKRALPTRGGSRPGLVIVDANRKVHPWRALVAASAVEAMGDREPFTGPLGVSFTFYRQRPKSHYGSGRNAGNVKASAAKRPTFAPDTTKLIRAVEDACTSIVWRDDAQIVTQIGRKLYGVPERCEVMVVQFTPGVSLVVP